jgi:hypothetical protein
VIEIAGSVVESRLQIAANALTECLWRPWCIPVLNLSRAGRATHYARHAERVGIISQWAVCQGRMPSPGTNSRP